MSRVFLTFFLPAKRRKRDLNPRAAINDLLPFQGSPFSLLGISPGLSVSSGEGGIRTHAPLRTNGFQDRLVMTTSIPLHASIFTNFSVRSANNDYSIRSGFSCQQLFFIFCNFLLVLQKRAFFLIYTRLSSCINAFAVSRSSGVVILIFL